LSDDSSRTYQPDVDRGHGRGRNSYPEDDDQRDQRSADPVRSGAGSRIERVDENARRDG
jgi:hypothetical protein